MRGYRFGEDTQPLVAALGSGQDVRAAGLRPEVPIGGPRPCQAPTVGRRLELGARPSRSAGAARRHGVPSGWGAAIWLSGRPRVPSESGARSSVPAAIARGHRARGPRTWGGPSNFRVQLLDDEYRWRAEVAAKQERGVRSRRWSAAPIRPGESSVLCTRLSVR